MTYKLDPIRKQRKAFNDLMNKGHFVALVRKGTSEIVMSANDAYCLKTPLAMRRDLELVRIGDLLDRLPMPGADCPALLMTGGQK